LELVPLDNHKDSKFQLFDRLILFVCFLLAFLLFIATDKNQVHIYQISNSVVSEFEMKTFSNSIRQLF